MPAPTDIAPPSRGLLARLAGAPWWMFAVGAAVLGLLTAGHPPAAGVLALRLVRVEDRWVPATVLPDPPQQTPSLTPDAMEARVVVTFTGAPGWLRLRATPTPIPPKAGEPAVPAPASVASAAAPPDQPPPPPPAELYDLWAKLARAGDPATAGSRAPVSPADQGLILRRLAEGRTTALLGGAVRDAYGLGCLACLAGLAFSLMRMYLDSAAADDAPDP